MLVKSKTANFLRRGSHTEGVCTYLNIMLLINGNDKFKIFSYCAYFSYANPSLV